MALGQFVKSKELKEKKICFGFIAFDKENSWSEFHTWNALTSKAMYYELEQAKRIIDNMIIQQQMSKAKKEDMSYVG